MNPFTGSTGYVIGQRTMPTGRPEPATIDHSGRARQTVETFGSSRMNPRWTSAWEKQWSGSRSTARWSLRA